MRICKGSYDKCSLALLMPLRQPKKTIDLKTSYLDSWPSFLYQIAGVYVTFYLKCL